LFQTPQNTPQKNIAANLRRITNSSGVNSDVGQLLF